MKGSVMEQEEQEPMPSMSFREAWALAEALRYGLQRIRHEREDDHKSA